MIGIGDIQAKTGHQVYRPPLSRNCHLRVLFLADQPLYGHGVNSERFQKRYLTASKEHPEGRYS
jgi:hypothetical protein